jgi:hypothetical protein
MSGGRITFRPVGSETPLCAVGNIQADGRFSLSTHTTDDGAVKGHHQAVIVSPLGGDRETAATARPVRVAARYASYQTSGLEFEVTDQTSSNHFEITVDREGAN